MFKGFILFSSLFFSFVLGQQVSTLTGEIDASGGIAIDQNGEVFVADFGNSLGNANGKNVLKVLRDGSYSIYAQGLRGASGNAFDSKGNLFQSNIATHKISKIDTAGNVTTFATNTIKGPVGIAIDKNDNVYVANCGGNNITKITPDGGATIFVEDFLFSCPNGLTIDDDGNLYTCNFKNGRVFKITPSKEVSLLATINSSKCGHLTYANNRLYVVGRCANKIFEVSLTGVVKVLAGAGARGNKDGSAKEATFNLPNGIRASEDGDTLFVNDAVATNGDCSSTSLNPVIIRMITGIKPTSGININLNHEYPENFNLNQNYPNPFNPSTIIEYQVRETSQVKILIYNIMGEHIQTLVDSQVSKGKHQVMFNAELIPSGVYFYNIVVNGKMLDSKRMVILR